MTLVRTGSINLSTDGPAFLREIFSLKSISRSLIALIDSSQVWLHFAKSKANPLVLPGCFRAINLLLPTLAGLRSIDQNTSRAGNLKVLIVKAGTSSQSLFVLGQSTWWICPGSSWLVIPVLAWIVWELNHYQDPVACLLVYRHSGADGLTKSSSLKVWEAQCQKALKGSGNLLHKRSIAGSV